MITPVIKVENLSREFNSKLPSKGFCRSVSDFFSPKYETVKAVSNLNFSIYEGERVGLIGMNGAGKSTVIKMLTGILYPSSGSISTLGYDPFRERKDLAYHISVVFGQRSQLWYHLKPIDSFKMIGFIYSLDTLYINKKIIELANIFEIEHLLNRRIRELSLGERMRCEIIASLLHSPKILFLDEPTIGLDIIIKTKIRELVKIISKKHNTTIILTSHDLEDIEAVCDRIIMMDEGVIAFDGSIRILKKQFLTKKNIEIITTESVKVPLIEGLEIITKTEFTASVEVDIKKIQIDKVIRELLKNNDIKDIIIKENPLDRIIKDIYEKQY